MSITSRLDFGTSAMHAYVHQWSCQIVYNPRIREGPGLSDGEGVERFWSRLRKMIGVTRVSAVWCIYPKSFPDADRVSSAAEEFGCWTGKLALWAQNYVTILGIGYGAGSRRLHPRLLKPRRN